MEKKYVFITFSLGNTSISDYFISLCKELSLSYNIIIISDTPKPQLLEIPTHLKVLNWPSARPTKLKDGFFLYRKIKKYKPVLTISNFGSVNMVILIGWILKVKCRVCWIHTLSSQLDQKKAHILRKSYIYRLATNIITNSEATKKDSIDVFGICNDKIVVLPNSVRNYSSHLSHIFFNRSKILYVGRLHRSKGVMVLIKAIAILINQGFDVYLDIIGSGLEKNNLQQLTHNLGITDKVNYLGIKSKEEVLSSLKNSYCSVVPSISEAFGYTVIEAMSVETCVIGANNTGIKEIIMHEDSGLLFETGNAIDLAKKLKLVINDFDLRQKLAKNGFKRYLNFYETNYAVNRDINFFKNIIN